MTGFSRKKKRFLIDEQTPKQVSLGKLKDIIFLSFDWKIHSSNSFNKLWFFVCKKEAKICRCSFSMTFSRQKFLTHYRGLTKMTKSMSDHNFDTTELKFYDLKSELSSTHEKYRLFDIVNWILTSPSFFTKLPNHDWIQFNKENQILINARCRFDQLLIKIDQCQSFMSVLSIIWFNARLWSRFFE